MGLRASVRHSDAVRQSGVKVQHGQNARGTRPEALTPGPSPKGRGEMGGAGLDQRIAKDILH